MAEEIIGSENFIQVFIDTPLEECIKRDTKNLYRKAISGSIVNFTGISSLYEIPLSNDLIIKTLGKTPEDCTKQLLDHILDKLKIE